MITKIVLLLMAVAANLYVFKWHEYDDDEQYLRIWHIVFVVAFGLGAIVNLFYK